MIRRPTVAIIGIGLIGGSLGQALRRTGRYRVIGIARRPSTLREAKRAKAIDSGSTHLSDIRDADIVVVAAPVDATIPLINQLKPYLKPQAIVTDVGSVKGLFDQKIRGVRFVGAHPLAGSHKTGVTAARPDLYKNAVCVLVHHLPSAARVIKKMWEEAGARVIVMTAAQHDAAVAFISHLPHLIAHALVGMVAKRPDQKNLKLLMAGSFRDMTRVAASDPEQWVQIFNANLPNLKKSIGLFQAELQILSDKLGRPSLGHHLKKSQMYRLPLFNGL